MSIEGGRAIIKSMVHGGADEYSVKYRKADAEELRAVMTELGLVK